MIVTSARNAAHQLDEPNMIDVQHTRSNSTSPRKSPNKQHGANHEMNPAEQQYSTDSGNMIKTEDVGVSSDECVPMSTSPSEIGDEETGEMNSSSSQCSCQMWTCSLCKKAFNSARALKIHEVKQHENMPKRYLKCSHCDEVFEHGNLLQIHMKVHHNIKVRCPQCKDIFDHPKALSMHVKAHNTEPVCPVCGVKFDHDKLLKLHMEHYHKVSKKEAASLPSEQLEVQTFQPLANLISPDSTRPCGSPERRRVNGNSLSPNDMHHNEATPSPGREENLREAFHDVKGEERNSRHRSQSPQEVNIPNQESLRREMFARSQGYDKMYHHRLLAPIHNRPVFYRPLDDKPRGPPPYGMMPFQSPGLRRRLEKRPLGRSHSFPLKQEATYHDMPPAAPWQLGEANPMLYGPGPREKRIDRAVLEAVRNNLKAKLRTVEATLLGEEGDPHHPLSSTLAEYYEQQGTLCSREELSRQYRPSVITPRTTFDSYPFKRKASPNDLEPQEKIRRFEGREMTKDTMDSPATSPSRKPGAIPYIPGSEMRPRFYDPVAQSMYPRPFNTRDDLSILKRPDDLSFGDQAKIFIKRGAPRCNRCQQTFSSKMEYLHHLISHREKDGLADESPEEMEFIEGVRRSMNLQTFAAEGQHRIGSNATPEGSLSPRGEEQRESQKVGGDDEEGDETKKKVNTRKSPGEQPSPLASQSEGDNLALGTATCSECKDVFADSMSCRMHIEKRHMKPRCRECGLTFDHKNLLKIHMDCYHSTLDVLQCYYCGMSFKQRSEFLDHLTSHETQEINKDKLGEQSSEASEPGGRRRWGRLVASAQLPSEKPDAGTKEHIPSRSDFLGTRETLLKSNGKTKLRKAVSLSTYTDMINRNKRRAADFLRDSRAKGDEVIGRETRTRIFLPNFEDRKMEDVSRFHSARSTDNELTSPLIARQRPPPEDTERLFLKRKTLQSRDDEARSLWAPERSPFASRSVEEKRDQVDSYIDKKDELQRLHRSVPGGEESMRNQHMPLFRKAFVRDEVETLYQLRHKKSFHNPEDKDRSSPPSEPSDHRSDLVKIERIELHPSPRQHKPVEREQIGMRPNYDSEQREEAISSKERRHNVPEQEAYPMVHSRSSPKRYHEETPTSVVPPPLIDIRRFSQTPSPLNVCSTVSTDSSPASSRSNSPLPANKSLDYKSNKGKGEMETSNSPIQESIDSISMKELKGKRRNSIKKLTKEALINSLSLKRRASAPDLYQIQRDLTEHAPVEKAESPKTDLNSSPGSPSVNSDDRASPVDTKHHGSRSLKYTPRKQSERDVTCTQCGVSFGHKKLYKIHLDSYHGKPQNHECLQCGGKKFRDKDEFLKHLMAHQTEDKGKGDEEEDKKNLVEERQGSEDSQRAESPVDLKDENQEMAPKAKIPRRDSLARHENKDMDDAPYYVSQVIVNSASKNDQDLNDENGLQSPRVNNNGKDLNDKTTCFTCGKTFENGKQLEQHFSSHASISEDGRFCCVLCGKAFETHRKLEIHSRSHTGFKPHKCEQCGRCFPYYSSYYYHKMTHTKDRPHKCPLCGKGFIQTRYLRSHLRTHKDEQGTLSDEVESIIQKVELNMNDETDEESIDSPGTAEGSPAYRANEEEAETAEILCSFKRGLNCSAQNSDSESPPLTNSSVSD